MLSIGAMKGGQGDYYMQLAKEDYYLSGGEPPGCWLGQGAGALGLTGQVEKDSFRWLLEGFSPTGAEALIQNAGARNHQPGWDLTFSAPKSVSAFWSQADAETRQILQEAHFQAVREALVYLEEAASWTRRGKGGCEREKAGLIVATFEHGTSRAQDPQLHTHALVLNVGTRADGTTGTIESKPLYEHKMAAGALYRAELAAQLEKRLGLGIERHRSWFEIRGVAGALIEAFSQRRQAIEEAMKSRGVESARAAAIAALDTREVKGHMAREALFDAWQRVGNTYGFSRDEAMSLVRKKGPLRMPLLEKQWSAQAAVDRLTRQQNCFSERDLIRATAEEAQGRGIGVREVLEGVRDYLAQMQNIVPLGRVQGQAFYTTREILAL